MMAAKSLLVSVSGVLLVVLVLAIGCAPSAAQKSVSQLSNGNIDQYLRDPNYVDKQIKCVLDRGQCDRVGGQLKLAIPEVINNNCARCTAQQANNARKLINFIEKSRPGVYQEVLAKYRRKQGNRG